MDSAGYFDSVLAILDPLKPEWTKVVEMSGIHSIPDVDLFFDYGDRFRISFVYSFNGWLRDNSGMFFPFSLGTPKLVMDEFFRSAGVVEGDLIMFLIVNYIVRAFKVGKSLEELLLDLNNLSSLKDHTYYEGKGTRVEGELRGIKDWRFPLFYFPWDQPVWAVS